MLCPSISSFVEGDEAGSAARQQEEDMTRPQPHQEARRPRQAPWRQDFERDHHRPAHARRHDDMLWLSPGDHHGARFHLAAVEAGKTRDEMESVAR
jgi:hypothetical protein